MRPGLKGAFGWRINRLADGAVGLEIVGSAAGYALAIFFLILGIAGLAAGSRTLAPHASIGMSLVVGLLSSFSTGHFIYRAALKRALATTGVDTRATVIDRWRLPTDRGAWSCVRLRFDSIAGPVEVMALDSTQLVRGIGIGAMVPLRYDPADSRRVVIDAGPRR